MYYLQVVIVHCYILPAGPSEHDILNTPPQIRDLLRQERFIYRIRRHDNRHDFWVRLAIQLQLDHDFLRRFEYSYSYRLDPNQYCFELLIRWEIIGPLPYTWATLIDALRSPLVEENQLADELQEWLLTNRK